MEETTRKLWIQSLKAQAEICRLRGIDFAKRYEASLTTEEKADIADRWDRVTKEGKALQRQIDQLEKQGPGPAGLN
jgi:hypothetical protein